MKKILLSLAVVLTLSSCNTTSTSEDTMMLQKAYPNAIVYPINQNRYIIVDSTQVSDLKVSRDGTVYAIIKIK